MPDESSNNIKVLMRHAPRLCLALAAALLGSAGWAQDAEPVVGIAQSAADELRTAAGTDLAFVAAGLFKEKGRLDSNDIASSLLFPTDEVVILTLTGAQIRQAFERSLVLYPQANSSFLYFSGGSVNFDKLAASGKRVTSISLDSGSLDLAKNYRVAMPASLGYGGLGYFQIWDQKAITGKYAGTMESVLRGKRASAGVSRWRSAR